MPFTEPVGHQSGGGAGNGTSVVPPKPAEESKVPRIRSEGTTPPPGFEPETVQVPEHVYEKFLYGRPKADQNAQRGSVCPYCRNPLSPHTKHTEHELINGTFRVRAGTEACQPCFRYVEAEYYLTADPGETDSTMNFEARMHGLRGIRRLAIVARSKATELAAEYIAWGMELDKEEDGATW